MPMCIVHIPPTDKHQQTHILHSKDNGALLYQTIALEGV